MPLKRVRRYKRGNQIR